MSAQSEQVISSFLKQLAYEKLAMSATWRIPPGSKVLMLGSFLDCLSCHTLMYSKSRLWTENGCG
jgi:hypothetical protein